MGVEYGYLAELKLNGNYACDSLILRLSNYEDSIFIYKLNGELDSKEP